MRYLSALIVGLGLSLPSISHAATPENAPQAARSSVQASAPAAPRASDKVSATTTPVKSATDDKSRYAAREAASPQAQSYRGGDTVVIGASTAAVILAVVLILVLI